MILNVEKIIKIIYLGQKSENKDILRFTFLRYA